MAIFQAKIPQKKKIWGRKKKIENKNEENIEN